MSNTMTQKELKNLIVSEIKKPVANYEEAKLQSQKIDHLLGFNCLHIERKLIIQKSLNTLESKQLWIGLDIQSLLTPYSEIFEMIQIIKPQENQKWIDLGAAYGRIGIVLNMIQCGVQFVGYEYVADRTNEANRIFKLWKLNQAHVLTADISKPEFILEKANIYFIYDFGSKKDIYIILEKLRIVAQNQPIQLIARGRGIKNYILYDFPWLYAINEPQYFHNWSLFKT